MSQLKKNEHGLNQRQQLFCEQYLIYGNTRVAAERAGYKGSYSQGVFRQKAVQDYLNMRRQEMVKKDIATADEVMKFLTDVARGFYTNKNKFTNEQKIRLNAIQELAPRVGLGARFHVLISQINEELDK